MATLASEFQQNKQFEESIIIYQSLLKTQPNNLTIHLNLALSLFHSKQYHQAKEHIEVVLNHENFDTASVQVKKNVNQLYDQVKNLLPLENITPHIFQNPTPTSNLSTSISSSVSNKTNATQLSFDELKNSDYTEEQSTGINLVLSAKHDYFDPSTLWKVTQSFNIQQNKEFYSIDDKTYLITSSHYDINYLHSLDNQNFIGANFAFNWIESDSFLEHSFLSQINYIRKSHYFSLSAKHHWQEYETFESIYNETSNTLSTITTQNADNFWILSTDYQSNKNWTFKSRPNELSLSWKSKLSAANSNIPNVQFEQFISLAYDISKRFTWTSQLYLSYQDTDSKQEDVQAQYLNKFSFQTTKHWTLYLTQQYKYKIKSTTIDQSKYDQWLHQLTLQWVN